MAGLLDGFDLGKDVKDFQRNTKNMLEKVKSNTLTPINTTTEKLKEGIAVVNAYDTQIKSRISNYKGQFVEQLEGVVGAISGGLLNVKDITKSIRVGKDGVTFSTDALLAAVSNNIGWPVSGKDGAMRKIARTVSAEFNRLTGLNMDQLIVVDGGKFRVTENWRGQLGDKTFEALRDLTGMDDFLDVSVQTSLYNSIILNSAMFGMVDAYKSLWDNYPYAALRQDAFIEAIGEMIKKGDVISIDAVLAMIDQQGKNVLLNKYPDFIEKLFTNFKFDSDALPEDYPAIRAKLLSVLVAVAGAEWMYRDTQFGRAYNMGLVSDISEDMATLLMPDTVEEQTNEYMPLLCGRGMFHEESALSILDKSFDSPPIVLLG